MRDRLNELGSSTRVVLVMFIDPDALEAYQMKHGLPFDVLSDPERVAYHSYGLGRGSVLRVWGLRAARRYLQIMRVSGVKGLAMPTEDTLQLGGGFVVGADGSLVYGF
ncbi:MAG: AhpC/TSA family protein, partial [Acidimicrobiales bacterium]